MMSLSCSMGCVHALSHEHLLAQKLLLQKALSLRLELREPSFPNPLRGMTGILAADCLLKNRGAVGLLVGGLADAVWSQRRTGAELSAHKDVDVLVLSTPESFEDFEEGVDWWMPHDIHFDSIKTQSGSIQNVTKKFWVNGFGCALCYRVTSRTSLEPGLYFTSPEGAVDIRLSECYASIDDTVAVMDEDPDSFVEKFRKKLGIRSKLPSFIARALGRIPVPYIGQPRHGDTPFRFEDIPLEEQRALNDHGEFHTGQQR